MLRYILLILAICLSSLAVAEETSSAAAKDKFMTISYGDISTDIEDTDTDASGWRLNLSFEHGARNDNVLHGFAIGYIDSSADVTTAAQTSSYKLESLPIYYAPKLLFGKSAFKGFLKGAIGIHFSDYERTGALGSVESQDTGLYAGASLGAMYAFNEKVFINAEYEWAYLSNSYYRDGELQSVMVGLGFRL